MSDASNPAQVTLALKLAYLRGNWDAVSVIIHALEAEFGEVRLSELDLRRPETNTDSMEAPDEDEDELPPLILIDWYKPAEA